jgi:predicted transposase YdaD
LIVARQWISLLSLISIERRRAILFIKGKIEGKIEKKREIAKKMLMEGLEIVFIARITGLSEQEIQQLSSERR